MGVVNLQDIKPYFDILIHNQDDFQNIQQYLNEFEYEEIEAYPIKEFHLEKKKFIRLYFDNHHKRKQVLEEISKYCSTYSNDLTNHYRKVAHEYKLNLNNWNVIDEYYTKDGINFYLSINDFDEEQPLFINDLYY